MKDTFKGLEEQKKEWDDTDTRLRAERAEMDTAASTATQADKDGKDGEIAAHQNTKQGIIDGYNQAEQARDDKENLINEAARIREE